MMETTGPGATAKREGGDFLALQQRVRGTNINEQTLLATDYLNHFNEIVMLLEMIPEIPECLEDAKEWRSRSYQDHFRASSFSDKELAIAAYDHSPAKYRDLFDETVARMNRLVETGIARIEEAIAGGERDLIGHAAMRASRSLQKLIDVASAVIHGGTPTMEQEEIDELIES